MKEPNNDPTARTPSRQNGVDEEGDYSRRNSASSSTTSPNYDSGNISDLNFCLRPASISSAEDDSVSNEYAQQDKFQHFLREKDQSLFLALQDVRKLKSELERLSKSEKWYKSELRSQKNSRMEMLEKLYTNERRFTQENQRLQNECIALYARCSEIENQLQEERESAIKLLQSGSKAGVVVLDGAVSRDFELEQHRQRFADQEQLIDMLRNQKRSLLRDLQKLSCEKDEIVLQLQKSIAHLEDENRTITKRCLQLAETKNVLKDELSAKGVECNSMSNEVLDLRIIVKSLQEKLHSHIADLNQKENEINNLKHALSQKENSDEISELLQRKHQHDLSEKLESICLLNNVINALKAEIDGLENLRSRYDEQQSEIVQLKYMLQERTSEVEALQKFNESISNQNEDLQSNTEKFKNTFDPNTSLKDENHKLSQQNLVLQRELTSLKTELEITSQSLKLGNLRKTKQELDQLSEKYLEVCKLYEKSKFESDMKDISVEKSKFEKEKDKHEIGSLREKLVELSKKFECQKSLSTEFELALSRTKQEKSRLENENKCNIEKNLELKIEVSQCVENLNEKDIEISNFKTQLSKVEDMLNKHNGKMTSNDVAALLYEKDSSESRVASIQRQLKLQSEKVKQMNAEQDEWENLLKVIRREEKLMESDATSSEFENLNQLFEEQNLELMQINENFQQQYVSLKQDLEKTEEENKTFQQELETAKCRIISLEKQVEVLESANVDYQKEIAHLAGTNDRLIQEFNEDFSRERENHKRQEKQLKLEVKLRTTECDELRNEMHFLHSEVDRLNTSQKLLESCDSDHQSDKSTKDVAQDRILQNVIETEHRRKMSRYDVHIRSLLSNIKSYKKKLETAENRYDALVTKSKEMVEVKELRAAETNLQNMRMQFECSQREINNLKHQLKTIQEEFYVTDVSKSSNTMDLTNLMDDYKKLIQQSEAAAKRPSTSDIYKLINKSNNFVPKLTNISTSVDGLREDIQQMCTVLNLSSPAGRGSPQPKMSLMDELKIAENGKMC